MFVNPHFRRPLRWGAVICWMMILGGIVGWYQGSISATAQVTIVSAASFEDAIAPDSIVAAFGIDLATETQAASTTPLPTELAGTTVKVNETSAPLFFVSPNQINFLVPASTPIGTAIVAIQSGSRTSIGEMKVSAAAPAIFTANGNGIGVPAAIALRYKPNSTEGVPEAIARFDQAQNQFVPLPIKLDPPDERVFLILFGTGLRRLENPGQSVKVLLGGSSLTPTYAGIAPGFIGLDQINVELPRSLIGSGCVKFSLTAANLTSNHAVIEIAPMPNAANSPIVNSFSPAIALAGRTLTIDGNYFDAMGKEKNQVVFPGVEACLLGTVESASEKRLSVKIPFGAASGKFAVVTLRGQGVSVNELTLTTSISGYIETTDGKPLPGVLVQVPLDDVISATTDKEGAFVLSGVPSASAMVIEILPPKGLPYPPITTIRRRVEEKRDNHIGRRPLQQILNTGENVLSFGTSGTTSAAPLRSRFLSAHTRAALVRKIQDNGITFEIEDNATAIFPGGRTSGDIYLNRVENSRTPVELPPGVFSSTIAQLTPFGVKLTSGGKLIFPNADRLPANSRPRLYRFDQAPGSPTLGSFVDAGPAIVSPSGDRIETLPSAVTETSIFLAAQPQPVTIVIGRILENDGATSVGGAVARANGQEATADGNGGFTLRNVNVPVNRSKLIVEASVQRPNGRVDRTQSAETNVVLNGVTHVGELRMPVLPPNRPPVVVAPSKLEITGGLVLGAAILAYDQDEGQPLQVNLAGPSFASLTAGNNNTYTLRLEPQFADARPAPYTLMVTATDSAGARTEQSMQLTVNANRAPSVVAPELRFTTPGMTLSFLLSVTDPDNTPPGLLTRQAFTFSSPNLPPGASITPLPDGISARFDWTPAAAGTVTPMFRVSDNGAPILTSESKATQIVVGLPWTRTGAIEAAQTFSLLFAGSNLFTATSGGVFLSTDQGQTWAPRNDGLTTLHINTLALSGTTLLAGTNGGGVSRSPDNGQSWTRCGNLTNGRSTYGDVRTLATNRGLYAGTFGGGVFHSTDGCGNWTPVSSGLANQQINALVFSGSTLYAGTEGGGVFALRDNEQTWQPAGLGNLKVRSLAVRGTTLLAGTDGNGIYLSTDPLQRWEVSNDGLTNPETTINALVADAANSNVVFACTSGDGVFRSVDQGRKWTALPIEGLKNPFISSFAIGIANTYLAGTAGGGVFRLANQTLIWTPANLGLATSTVNAIASPNSLYAGTAGGGVFRSNDRGQNWTVQSDGLTAPFVNGFSIVGNTLFAATNGGVFAASISASSLSWASRNNGLPGTRYAIALAATPAALYVGIAPDGGVYRSEDLGQSWRPVNKGLTDKNIQSLAASGSILLAGTENGGIFRTTDGGENWVPANAGLTGFRAHALASAPLSAGSMYAGTDNGVHRSLDQGSSWTIVNVGLPDRAFVNALALRGTNLYAGIFGGFYFSNQGREWAAANIGLTHINIFALHFDESYLYAGTIGGGVYRILILEVTR